MLTHWTAGLLLLLANSTLPNEPRRDVHGDPLPPGAVARFGTSRLVHPHVSQADFSHDNKLLATSGEGVRLWDLRDGRAVELPHLPRRGQSWLAFTPEGWHVLATAEGLTVIEPTSGKKRAQFPAPKQGSFPEQLLVSGDGKIAVVNWSEHGVEVYDLAQHLLRAS